jgi:ribonuclease E
VETLTPVLESAGLVWVNTDQGKLRAAEQAAATHASAPQLGRERKASLPDSAAPMQQVETAKHD